MTPYPTKPNMVQLTVYLDKELLEKIKDESIKEKRNVSNMVEVILIKYFKEKEFDLNKTIEQKEDLVEIIDLEGVGNDNETQTIPA